MTRSPLPMHFHLDRSLTVLLLTAALATPAASQLPPGQCVVAGFSCGSPNPLFAGTGGLFFLDPTAATPTVTPVTGLPLLCTGSGPSGPNASVGAQWVVRIPSSGKLVTNGQPAATVSGPMEVYVVTLAGAAATSVQTYPVATYFPNPVGGTGNCSAALLADERVLMLFDRSSTVAPGPISSAWLGILDPNLPPGAPGALTTVPVASPPSGISNAVAVDNDRGVAYVAVATSFGFNLWSVPVPGGGTPTLIPTANTIFQIHNMAMEPGGTILVGGTSSTHSRQLFRVDPVTLTITPFPNLAFTNSAVNGLCLDPVSGDLYIAHVNFAGSSSFQKLSPCSPTGAVATITNGPATGWGCPSHIDMSAWLEVYGAASGASALPHWNLAPNPGGSPTVGNGAFSLTSTSAGPNLLNIWGVGFTRASFAVPPVTVLVNPVLSLLQPGDTLSLPIPVNPLLVGLQLFVQCGHLDYSASLTASSGLHLIVH